MMKVTVFNTKPYEEHFFKRVNSQFGHELIFLNEHLTQDSTALAKGSKGICIFVNDITDASILKRLKEVGVELIALRWAGFNNVNLETAEKLGLCVVRVPAYSPYAVAKHTVSSAQFTSAYDSSRVWAVMRGDYDGHRPHSSLGDLTPVEFAESCITSGQTKVDLQQYSQDRKLENRKIQS